MNFYAILLFILFSPWAWLIMGVLVLVFIYANVRFSVTNAVNRRLLTNIRENPRTPQQQADMALYLKSMSYKHKPEFWFVVLLVTGTALIVMIGLPMLCTYAVHC